MARRKEKTWIDGEGGSWLIFGIAIGGLALYAGLVKAFKRAPTQVATSGFGATRLGAFGCCGPCQEARRGYYS